MDGLGVSTGRRRGLRLGWGGCGGFWGNRLVAWVELARVAIEIIAMRFDRGELWVLNRVLPINVFVPAPYLDWR